MIKRILILGAKGQIGSGFQRILKNPTADYKTYFIDSSKLDYNKMSDMEIPFKNIKPDIVINCVAYTNVDGAELPENRELCRYLNVEFPCMIAAFCKKYGAEFIHFSTDYVYNGIPQKVYTELDDAAPLNYYGKTKLRADKILRIFDKVKIFRVQAVYSPHNSNFYKAIDSLCNVKPYINVVADQLTCPTHAYWIADMVYKTLDEPAYGLFHLKPNGNCSFADFAELISDGRAVINRVTTEQYGSRTKRPKNANLSNEKFKCTFGRINLDWKQVYQKYKS